MGFSSVSIRQKFFAMFGLVALAIGIAQIIVYFQASEQVAASQEVLRDTETLGHDLLDLIETVGRIRFDVVQVQQWLTDISATRGLDGLDDGYSQAESFAAAFRSDVAHARTLADRLGDAGLEGSLGAVATAFDPYYAAGRRMAEAYVAEGPAGGNPMMGDFDAAAEAMTESVAALTEQTAALRDTGLAEVRADVNRVQDIAGLLQGLALVVTLTALLVTALAAWGLTVTVSRPVHALTGAMLSLADGNEATEIEQTERGDEIGAMARAVQVFKTAMIERRRADETVQAKEVELARAKRVEELNRSFEHQAGERLQAVSQATGELRTAAGAVRTNADHALTQAATVATASEQASGNVQAVATAAEELGGSIGEITRQMTLQAEKAEGASAAARDSETQLQRLDQMARKIGDVVNLINAIARQTNLLALNATIEAARAGDAGKGFEVVASEVKNLARQTAQATEDIGAQISAMQAQATTTVGAINGILAQIDDMAEIATAVATAVNQQETATREIARNAQEAARRTADVTGAIAAVDGTAHETRSAADGLLDVAGTFTNQAEALHEAVQSFLTQVRRA